MKLTYKKSSSVLMQYIVPFTFAIIDIKFDILCACSKLQLRSSLIVLYGENKIKDNGKSHRLVVKLPYFNVYIIRGLVLLCLKYQLGKRVS